MYTYIRKGQARHYFAVLIASQPFLFDLNLEENEDTIAEKNALAKAYIY